MLTYHNQSKLVLFILMCSTAVALAFLPIAAAAQTLPLIFDVDFEDKTSGSPIGTGGAAAKEPVWISPGLLQEVIATGSGNALRIEKESGNSAKSLRWYFIQNIEARSGIVDIKIDLKFDSFDGYIFYVRENGGIKQHFFCNFGFVLSG